MKDKKSETNGIGKPSGREGLGRKPIRKEGTPAAGGREADGSQSSQDARRMLLQLERFYGGDDADVAGDDMAAADGDGQGGPMPPETSAPAEPVRKKVLFKECAVAGVSFHLKYDDELWDELEAGTKVALVRENGNQYDRNAVAIALAGDYEGNPDEFDFNLILGYIPRTENAEIARMLDMGWDDVFVAELTTVKTHGSLNDRLRISIFIQSKDPETVRPDLLRGLSLSLPELRHMVEELSERGTAFFRFGGFPPHELQFPEVGERIVMVQGNMGSAVLYLMRVLATGEDCARYVEDPESVHCTDDCAPFILTNIAGPVRIGESECRFLPEVDLKGLSATEYLPKKVSSGFERLFEEVLFRTLNRDGSGCGAPATAGPEDGR